MTFNIGRSGTHAGWRTVRPKPEGWECEICDRFNRGYLVRCLGCGALRPS